MSEILESTIKRIGQADRAAMEAARARQDRLTKPQGSLGRLEELSVQLAGIQGKSLPEIRNKAIITMAGDHGVVAEGVTLYPQEVTAQMVYNFLGGGAGVNVMSRQVGARVVVVDMGVAAQLGNSDGLVLSKIAPGTQNMARGPAMSRAQAIAALEAGIRIVNAEVARGLDIVGTGDMGIANTTPSAALCAAITGCSAAEATGRGTGVEGDQLKHKQEVVARALSVNCPGPTPPPPLDVLAGIGGFEIAGLAGVMLGAAAQRVPVVIDGFISGAAALAACALCPPLKDFLIAAHLSAEVGHRIMLRHLGLKPLLDLDMRLGEGTGAALGIFLCETACRILAEMATFGEAGVSGRTEG